LLDPALPPLGDGEAGERAYSIASVDRALDLLDALTRLGPASMAVLAESAGCTRSAAFRILRTLQTRGFAAQDQSRGLWRLGARCAIVGRAALVQGKLEVTALPHVQALAAEIGETVYFIVRNGLEGEALCYGQPTPPLRLYFEAGKLFALHAGPGRILLAHAPVPVQTQVLNRKLQRFTPATRTDANWIAADLPRIQARGWLVTSDEMFPGSVSISAPVRDSTGEVAGAVAIVGPTFRMRSPRPRSLLPQLQAAALRISEALGAGAAPPGAPSVIA
jgi:DNA-binding IclR family transcriptional regulator